MFVLHPTGPNSWLYNSNCIRIHVHRRIKKRPDIPSLKKIIYVYLKKGGGWGARSHLMPAILNIPPSNRKNGGQPCQPTSVFR